MSETIFKRCEARWDTVSQLIALGEECAEVAAAILRRLNEKCPLTDVIDEAADASIMIEQFKRRIGSAIFDEARRRKFAKLAARLDALDASDQPA